MTFKYLQLLLCMWIRVNHRHVDQIANAVNQMAKLRVPVFQRTLGVHPDAVQNVFSVQSVRTTKHALIKNVSIRVQTFVEQTQNAGFEITVRYALV